MVFLAPALARILDACTRHAKGEAGPEEALEALPDAVRFVTQGGQLFEMLHAGILRTDEVEELIRQIRLEHHAQSEAVKLIDEALRESRPQTLVRATGQLRSSSERLMELFASLQEHERKEKVYSPYPVIDHFIKSSINVLNGALEPALLKDRLAPVAGLVQGLRGEVECFGMLYEQPALAQEARAPLEQMEAGAGAALGYLQEPSNKKVLEDSCKLLGAGSARLGEVMTRFDEVASQNVKFSKHRALEELGRAQAGTFPPELVQRTRRAVGDAMGMALRELEGIRMHPLAPELETELQEAHSAWEGCRRLLETEGKVPELDAAFNVLDEKLNLLRGKLGQESVRFAGAPHLAALRELIGRGVAGTIPKGELKETLAHYKQQHQELVAQLEQGAHDPTTAELLTFLAAHGAAFTRMEMFFDDGDREHLRQGWQLIAVTLPRVLELTETLRERLGQTQPSKGPAHITCFRCGTANHPELRHCKQCNAVLPKIANTVTEYTEITGSEGGLEAPVHDDGPANLVALENMARAAEAGQISRQELGEQLDRMLAQADRTRQQFEKQVIGLMGRDSTFDAYAQFFAMKMNGFVQGLLEMRGFAEGKGLTFLHSGLVACKDAGEELQSFQDRIQQALGKKAR